MGLFDNMKAKRADKKAEKAKHKEIIKEFKQNGAENFGFLLLDTKAKRGVQRMFGFKLFDFSDIKSFDVNVDNHVETTTTSKKKHGITRAVVGGVVAGPAGAIIGGMTGKNKGTSTSKEVIDRISITIWLKDGSNLGYSFNQSQQSTANKLINMLNTIVKENESSPADDNSKDDNLDDLDNLDQLKKLKELLDMNAITKEEYEAKKKDLLNL